MSNITVSTPVHKFMQSSQKRDMQGLLNVPLPFAAFTHTLTQNEWRKAAKFTSTKNSGTIYSSFKTSTGYARMLNHDGTWQAVAGTGSPNNIIGYNSKTTPTDGKPSFYAIIPCDASGNVDGDITYLRITNHRLTSIDVTGLSSLTYLSLNSNQLTSIDVTGLSSLTYLNLSYNHLSSFDPTGLSSLTTLYLSYNQLTSFDATELSSLIVLLLNNNQIASLDTTGLSSLRELTLQNNQLTSFDGTGLSSMYNFYITNNQLTSFLVGDMTLEDIYSYHTALDLSNQQLGVDALNLIYADLPDGDTYGYYPNTINVTGNIGAGAGTGTNPSVATAKGWTVIGDS